jgi:phospholipid/cholesterol/gamma-HCH transport system ATP-binding protein
MINDMIVELNEKLNVTSVAVTHDMRSAYKIADRMVMLYGGNVEIDGTPDEIENTDNEVVRQFVTGSARGPINIR